MNWLEHYLNENEELIFHTRSHKLVFIKSIPAFLLGLADILFLLAGVLFLLYASAKFLYYEYVITSQRVIIKKGLFYIRTEDIWIDDIEDVLIRRSPWDTIIKGGTVFIYGESISTQKLSDLDKPVTFRNALYSQLPASSVGYFTRA